jgi:hypothetical protein
MFTLHLDKFLASVIYLTYWNVSFFFFLFFLFIRYFLHLHFKCYSESSLYPPPALLHYPLTPTSWPWRSFPCAGMYLYLCRHMPGHTSREVLIIFSSLTTCDPSNIYDLIKVGSRLRLDSIALAFRTVIFKVIH